MSNLLPFEPPYQPISAEFAKALLEHAASPPAPDASNKLVKGTKGTKGTKAAGPASAAKTNVFFLVVPFAEKEDAKALGARWDAVSRKWYVPTDKDLAQFKRWMPKA